jgi:Fe-S cluster assembly scaffold protein SufB
MQKIILIKPNAKPNWEINLTKREPAKEYLFFFIGKNNDQIKLNTLINHQVKNSKANISIIGVLLDQSQAFLQGKIKISKTSPGCISSLSQNVLILSQKSKCQTLPQTEVQNQEVKVSHNSVIAPLDKNLIQILNARGFKNSQTKKILISGFLNKSLAKIKDKNQRTIINKEINKYV